MFWRTALIIILGIVNIGLLGKVIWGSTGIMEYRSLKAQLSSLRERVNTLDAENLALSREIRLLQSDEKYMEKMIRQRLRYMRDNEIVYVFTSGAGKQAGVRQNDGKN